MATVQQGQSLVDIAMQHSGDASADFALALFNDKSVTDTLIAGEEVEVNIISNIRMVEYLQQKKIVPASDRSNVSNELQEGIGIWQIGVDFKVS